MRRAHSMPSGAECLGDGTVRFRLWAPAAKSVRLVLIAPEHKLEMPEAGDGWFEISTSEAEAGTQYRFEIDGKDQVPDPASRYQPLGVHGPSEVIDPKTFAWTDQSWRGRPWNEAVIYELHVGTFSPEGTFAGVESKLDYLSDLGITAIEIMPVSSFPGDRNWGYDGVLPYAPAAPYGRPEDLKHLINAAHEKNMMVLLDVVYNHFGPEGNYLTLYAPQFFTERHKTPWGEAINFDGVGSRAVRDYFIHNALYWLEEYHLDGLRLDAVHAIVDDSQPDILIELAGVVRNAFPPDRQIHLVLENFDNAAHYLSGPSDPEKYDAQWNDDIHHALHVLITQEDDGYYADYAGDPAWHLGRCLAEGFSYQGDFSHYHNAPRGERSSGLPPFCFVSFMQNHDQIGNRAFGERIGQIANAEAVKLAMTCLLLAPSPPLLFMGQEFGANTPFLFFCDFGPDLASKVTQGRRSEFAKFVAFSSDEDQARIPDPNSPNTFISSKLNWNSLQSSEHTDWLQFYTGLLTCRRDKILPLSGDIRTGGARFNLLDKMAVSVFWPLRQGGGLTLRANFSDHEVNFADETKGRLLYSCGASKLKDNRLAALSALWSVQE
jgi:maltooligosyltrehalose trehalohydrolase